MGVSRRPCGECGCITTQVHSCSNQQSEHLAPPDQLMWKVAGSLVASRLDWNEMQFNFEATLFPHAHTHKIYALINHYKAVSKIHSLRAK